MRYVSFVALLESGKMAAVAAGPATEPVLAIARVARDAGLATVNGESVPIIGGCVFASDALLQGPALEFRCLTPKQRKAKAEADAKAAKEAKAKAEAEKPKG